MARIRTVKPEFWSDEKLATVPRDARLLFAALLNMAEDHGVARGNPAYIRSNAFPYDEDVTHKRVSEWLAKLEAIGVIRRFGFDGQTFIHVVNFSKHQKIDRPSKTTLPNPPPLDEGSTRARRGLDEGSLLDRKGREGSGKEEEGRGVEAATPQTTGPAAEDLQGLWNECKAPEQPRWDETNEKRRTLADARLKERPLRGERSWEEVFRRLAVSSFARGLVQDKDGRTWIAGPKFFLQPEAATKVLEGTYDDRKGKPIRADWQKGRVGAEEVDKTKLKIGDLSNEF